MNEEEIINILNNIEFDDYEYTYKGKYNNIEPKKVKEAIQSILDLYNKEKEKNKTLESLLQGYLYEMYKYYKDLCSSYQANSVSKDKIRAKIKELEEKRKKFYNKDLSKAQHDKSMKMWGSICYMKELLEEK